MLNVQLKFVNCMLLLPGNTSCVTFSLQFRSFQSSSDLFLPFSPDFLISVHHLRSFHFTVFKIVLALLKDLHIFTWFLVNLSPVCPPWYFPSPLSLPAYFYPTEIAGGHSTWNVGLSQTLLQNSMANYLEYFFFLQKKHMKLKEKNLKPTNI